MCVTVYEGEQAYESVAELHERFPDLIFERPFADQYPDGKVPLDTVGAACLCIVDVEKTLQRYGVEWTHPDYDTMHFEIVTPTHDGTDVDATKT